MLAPLPRPLCARSPRGPGGDQLRGADDDEGTQEWVEDRSDTVAMVEVRVAPHLADPVQQTAAATLLGAAAPWPAATPAPAATPVPAPAPPRTLRSWLTSLDETMVRSVSCGARHVSTSQRTVVLRIRAACRVLRRAARRYDEEGG